MHWLRLIGPVLIIGGMAACSGSTGSGTRADASAGSGGNGGSASGSGGTSTGGSGGTSTGGSGGADAGCVSQLGGHCGGNIANPCTCASGLVCKLNGIPDTGGTCQSGSGGSGGSAGSGGGSAGGSGGGTGGSGTAGTGGSLGGDAGCVSQQGGFCGGNIANPCTCASGLACHLNSIPDTGGKCEPAP